MAGLVAPFDQPASDDAYRLAASELRQFIRDKYLERRPINEMEVEAENEGKFASTQMEVLDLKEFHKGLESRIGFPATIKTFETMEREHGQGIDPRFNPLDPKEEWDIVIHGPRGRRVTFHHNTRDIEHNLTHYVIMAENILKEAGLSKEEFEPNRLTEAEVAGLRLWTGPMYRLYVVLFRDEAALASAEYTTTLHAINSGISKLAKIWKIPTSRKVYRGYSGMKLPRSFMVKDKFGGSGGVEPSVLATTENWKTAVFFSVLRPNGQKRRKRS